MEGPPRGECVLPQLLPLCNKPCLEALDQFSIVCFIVNFTRLIELASGFLRRLHLNFIFFFNEQLGEEGRGKFYDHTIVLR